MRLGIGERPSTATDGSLSIIGRDDRARSDFDKLSDYAEQQGRDRSEIGTDAWASMGDKSSSDVPAGDLCQSVGLTVWAEHGSGDRGGIVVEESGFQVDINAPSAYEAQVRPLMAPFVDVLVNSTVTAGDAVLDVACGTGFATRAAAAVAGRDARVEGSDLNPAMVAHARSVADGSGANLTWREASALELPHEDGEFDAVICQQGLQFFPDPAAGVREMGRVSTGGGRVGVTVWSASLDSPFLHWETEMLARHGGGAQAEFSASEAQLRDWFRAGGVDGVEIERIEVEVDLPPVLSYVPAHLKALPWSVGFFALPVEQQQAALIELETALTEFRTADGIRVPFSSYLATATI